MSGETTTATSRVAYAAMTVVIVAAGLAMRWPGLGLPWPVAKYAGSLLWGAMVYGLIRVIAPAARQSASFAIACTIAVTVELSRLIHPPALDAFRLTLAGQLLLGRIFSPWNIAAYGAGICASSGFELLLRDRSSSSARRRAASKAA